MGLRTWLGRLIFIGPVSSPDYSRDIKKLAHDIRAPLTALNTVVEDSALPDERREMGRDAIARIETLLESPTVPERVAPASPFAEIPENPQIEVCGNGPVVVIDDDPLVHWLWENRLEGKAGFQFVHYNTPESFVAACRNGNLGPDARFLVDFEFKNSAIDGLDLIVMLGITEESLLVTNAFDDDGIKARADALNVKILPKTLAPHVALVGVESRAERYLLS